MSDSVNHPGHYAEHFPFEAIDAIELILNSLCPGMTPFQHYCIGNALKYRFRAGLKDDAEKDIKKALKYMEFYQNSDTEDDLNDR